jgi:hypothetical protein
MCGGVGYKTKNIPESELKKYYSPELVKRFKKEDRIESFFWHDKATLPIKWQGKTQLMFWGNKDKNIKLPPTGWAREESLKDGKWDYLKPEEVDIPVDEGYEKKTWFDFKNGTKGVVVKRDNEERVYMITREASKEYEKKTGHGREPLGEKGNYEQEPGKQNSLL